MKNNRYLNQILMVYILVGFFLTACTSTSEQTIEYPETKTVDQVDHYFGTAVADPYRWLEDNQSKATAEWIQAQQKVTNRYLEKIPFRDDIKTHLKNFWNYAKYQVPFKAGDRIYYFKNDGLQNQDVMYVQDNLEDEPAIFLDPNTFSRDGTVALTTTSFSNDGSLMAYTISEAGSDWRKILVLNSRTQELIGDTLRDVKFGTIAWQGNEGFYYSRYKTPAQGSELTEVSENHRLYYHKVGTSQAEDIFVFGGEETPRRYVSGKVSDDGRFLIIHAANGTSGNEIYFRDLSNNGEITQIIGGFDSDNYVVHTEGEQLYILTNLGAPNKRIVTVSAVDPEPRNWVDLIPERSDVLIESAFVGGKMILTYLQDAATRLEQYDLHGNFEQEISLPTLGTAYGFRGKITDQIVFYKFTSFTYPGTIYAYNISSGSSSVFRQEQADIQSDHYITKQVFYQSLDGTEIPMFIVHHRDLQLDGNNPTILYGYGGFNISMLPRFTQFRAFWLKSGGIFAMPNLRGGGVYGKAWHLAGTRMNKQNVFDDFIAAAEYLKETDYTSTESLAILGGSNGGLLVGATLTQRPDICKVAVPAVGVMDMLRYHKFTAGPGWAPDYGIADSSQAMFEYLHSYSPLHNIENGEEYPATLVTTADHDDRVVPAHSFKFIATLQAKHDGEAPVLIRIESKSGHGAGKPTSKTIDTYTDIFAFTFYNMGIAPESITNPPTQSAEM
ncbi:MAG: prolyl oligopeptidase family serine peptidase [Candidatus Marinimicrobia bacterium]|nr:prolyl oligopeptidase family serine peptidase [Candidatus Neomarinimicrobiota bacterium]